MYPNYQNVCIINCSDPACQRDDKLKSIEFNTLFATAAIEMAQDVGWTADVYYNDDNSKVAIYFSCPDCTAKYQ